MSKNELRGIGKPRPLADNQVSRMSEFHDLTHEYATKLLELLPNVPVRARVFELLREVQTRGEEAVRFGRSILTPEVVSELFTPVQARGMLVVRLWLSAHEWADLRKHSRDWLDFETQLERMKAGHMGNLWGAEIRVSKNIPQGHVYLVAADEGEEDLALDWAPDASKLIRL